MKRTFVCPIKVMMNAFIPDMAEQDAGCRDAGTTRLLGAKLPKARHPEVRSSARLMLEDYHFNWRTME